MASITGIKPSPTRTEYSFRLSRRSPAIVFIPADPSAWPSAKDDNTPKPTSSTSPSPEPQRNPFQKIEPRSSPSASKRASVPQTASIAVRVNVASLKGIKIDVSSKPVPTGIKFSFKIIHPSSPIAFPSVSRSAKDDSAPEPTSSNSSSPEIHPSPSPNIEPRPLEVHSKSASEWASAIQAAYTAMQAGDHISSDILLVPRRKHADQLSAALAVKIAGLMYPAPADARLSQVIKYEKDVVALRKVVKNRLESEDAERMKRIQEGKWVGKVRAQGG